MLNNGELFASERTSVCNQVAAPDASGYMLYPDITEVFELAPYVFDGEKHIRSNGKRLGVYHPLFSKVSELTEDEWRIYDSLKHNLSEKVGTFEINAIQNLLKSGIVIDKNTNWNVNISPQFDEIDVYIKTTEGCNFSCKGCVTASDIIQPSMARLLDPEVCKILLERAVVSSIEKNAKRINFKWAGGEPLLSNAFKVISACGDFVADLRKRYPQIRITQSLLSNGVYATPEKIDFLAKNDIHISVSLWGTPDYQDKMRLPRNKVESFQRIIDNLRYIAHSSVSWSVSFVVTPENAADFPNFITMIWDTENELFIGKDWDNPLPFKFDIGLFRPQHGQTFKDGELESMENGIRAGFEKIRSMIERNIPIPQMDRFDYLDLFNTIVVPCGSGYNYLAIGPDGVAACHEELYKMKSNIDRIMSGENMFDIANHYYKPFRDQLVGNNIDFGNANKSVLSLHGGQGCPRLAYSEHGKLGSASSISQIYNNIFEEIICLETMKQNNSMNQVQ